jgi:hypothetical protein
LVVAPRLTVSNAPQPLSILSVQKTVTTAAPNLEYAPVAPIRRRRRRRRIVLGLTLLVFALAAWRLGPRGWHHAQLLYWQRQCMSYIRSNDTPSWEADVTRAAALITANPDYVAAPTGWGPPMATHLPKCLRDYERLGGLAASSNLQPILFVHEMRSPSGHRRLVVVSGTVDAFLSAFVYAPAGAWSAPRKVGQGSYANPTMNMTGFHIPVSPYQNGQPDPADPSRFTIPMIYQRGSPAYGAIEGRLTDDDQITFNRIDLRSSR